MVLSRIDAHEKRKTQSHRDSTVPSDLGFERPIDLGDMHSVKACPAQDHRCMRS
ncbi:MAG TPA: hypothetical protein VLW65_23995 [Bryobacteraceae bacterium]|nr:hypothetical protein [Bryobacteraceae bacterium]